MNTIKRDITYKYLFKKIKNKFENNIFVVYFKK